MKIMTLPGSLVSVDWLMDNASDPGICLFDASWHMPSAGRNAEEEFESKHIHGARFFDIDALSDHATDLPHMLPRKEAFTESMQTVGLRSDHCVIVYDSVGLFSAARAWWMLRVFGHPNVAVLDGGLPGWIKSGGALESGEAAPVQHGDFVASDLRPEMLTTRAHVCETLLRQSGQVVDARSSTRFSGAAADPRPGVRAGHMPGAVNLPFSELIDEHTGLLLSPDAVIERFSRAGVDVNQPVVTSCGSGVTACILALALDQAGYTAAVYDGSWAEWGSDDSLPVTLSVD